MAERVDILAIVVLYGMQAEVSPAYTSLTRLLSVSSIPAIDLMLWDNNATEQPAPSQFLGIYRRDTSNPGLARAYREALAEAARRGIPWLLLLDQDTSLTHEYLVEMIAACSRCLEQSEIVALVPRLAQRGVVCSPAYPPRLGPSQAVLNGISGIASETLHVFNSGAVVRVSALQAIGGFPEDFPIDYLDHATFVQLQRRGGKLYLLDSVLEHQLSSSEEGRTDEAFTRRQAQVLDAEQAFYNRYGTAADRIRRRVRLLRACLGRVVRRKERGQTWRMLKSALRP
jgi:GT2 family glycosyltransferase